MSKLIMQTLLLGVFLTSNQPWKDLSTRCQTIGQRRPLLDELRRCLVGDLLLSIVLILHSWDLQTMNWFPFLALGTDSCSSLFHAKGRGGPFEVLLAFRKLWCGKKQTRTVTHCGEQPALQIWRFLKLLLLLKVSWARMKFWRLSIRPTIFWFPRKYLPFS